MKNYIDLLTKLIAMGDKLPAAFAICQVIFAEVQKLIALFTPAEADGLSIVAPTPDESAAEGAIIAELAAASPGSLPIVDLSFLRQLFAMAVKIPQVLAMLEAALDLISSLGKKS